jgi:hypothetical protein
MDDDNSVIDFNSLNYTIPPLTTGAVGANYNYNTLPYGNVTISTTNNTIGQTGQYLTSGLNGTSWATTSIGNGTSNSGSLQVTGDAEFNGDIKWKGRSLGKMLEGIEDRLAILQPDPAKLEKYAALKKAYDHYKLMEKLIGED